ncbi:MAG TPA: MMPL family transporter [Polyangiaceae bacterium LLY-WYZ-15_(1-7)]|nr:MMPL family transporter [Polyangiaceae bacterium LLY-WYZ-15_(1-7)]HJL03885.1 MMPL family transporter [Polyangiaceae bacterium LLY-WYZ-15_(1-7)]HJL07621.1 MMPL family transporter [Polyangiaceae bacterium LLY-WYZ-15_(1-7)]HJL20645.1 MMPL family transporter [Polyangiaceae bacterium LLY-WYZ-15_(1-7)]HJL36097.1 MMPL family transporter [Polyangiaceae bacterium LLY-WYZ-15_(1-7)]
MSAFSKRLAAWQSRRAGTIVAAAFLVGAASLFLVKDLGLNSAWTALLPENAPSVQDLEHIQGRVGGLSTLTVALQSEAKDVEAMQAFARDLVEALEGEESGVISSVDWNVTAYADFVWEHRHLYAEREDLEEIRDALQERLRHERATANPFYIDLEDEEPPDPSELIERMQSQAEEGREKLDRFPGGFYLHPDRDLLVLFVRADLKGGDAIGSRGLMRLVDRTVADLDPASYGAGDLTVEYAGDVVVALEEQEAIARELVIATVATIVIVLLAIYFFFRRLRSIVLLGGALIPPVLVTFGCAELAVDYLNTSTAFLGSIVIGNGVNPNIIWLSRYFEERRRGAEVEASIAATHQNVWLGTLTASLAAALAYGSLMVTDFRGFRDFGIIGFIGMVLCWLGALVLLPALTALFERWRPLGATDDGTTGRGVYAALFSRIVHRSPRGVLAFSVLLTLASGIFVTRAVLADPLEYDFKKLKSNREGTTAARAINRRVHEMVGSSAQGNGIAVVVDHVGDLEPLEDALEEREGEVPRDTPVDEEGTPLWLSVHSLRDLLPKEQEAKLPLLADIRQTLLDLREFADDEQREEIDAHIPPEELATLGLDDLPEPVARSFTERDGTRGRILVIEANRSIWDGKYLLAWSRALREYDTESGDPAHLAGRGPVFADMIDVVVRDGPRAILWSFLATLVLSLLTFRRLRERLLTMMSLLLGIGWMAGLMASIGMKLNFLNFVAFPITFGNGVDYGVNVMRRYSLETDDDNPDAVRAAIENTGGAVILCSLTTIIGYTSLYTSANQAINSFGLAMAISEVTCVVSAVLTMPAILLLLSRRDRAADDE